MGIINLLPENLINQIAAGEVVERPASVVKELIENSIDAGATEIMIDIEDGGKRLIKVSDNGSGMTKEDALLSLRRHATSKIQTPEDLFNIETLGFRGEALPSIASVSRLTLTTIPAGSIYGASIHLEGGREMEVKECGGPTGTVVEVRDLFFNTPARLKFLKSPSTELSHITEAVVRMGIACVSTRFLYRHKGSTVLNLPSASTLPGRISALFNEEENSFIPVSLNSNVSVTGYISGPEINRPTQRGIYLFVNGRFVKDRVVTHALMEGYRAVLEKDRFPLAFLFIEIPPNEVDVNVHPAKSEVRFRNNDEVHRAVYGAVSEGLKGWTIRKSGVPLITGRDSRAYNSVERPVESVYNERVRESLETYGLSKAGSHYESSGIRDTKTVFDCSSLSGGRSERQASGTGFFSSLKLMGSVAGTYLVCSNSYGLYLIDQHAAHERVAFERLKKSMETGSPEMQALLIPESVQLTAVEASAFGNYLDALSSMGLEMEHFGGNTFIIKSVPAILAKADFKRLAMDIADEVVHIDRSKAFSDSVESLISRMACHSSVEAGDRIDEAEARALFRDLDSIDFSSNCPHGRPVFVSMSMSDLEKMFKRR